MKVLNVLAVVALCLVSLTVGGCRKRHFEHDVTTVYVPDPIVVNTNITTTGGITIVEVVDPNGALQDPNSGITQDLLNKDLDYQVLYFWYQRELNEKLDFQTFIKSARFHLIVDCNFKVNRDRNVHYAVIPDGFDIYIAVLRKDAQGHYCADADPAMDLLSGDTNEGHDRHPGQDFPVVDAPNYPTTGYFILQ